MCSVFAWVLIAVWLAGIADASQHQSVQARSNVQPPESSQVGWVLARRVVMVHGDCPRLIWSTKLGPPTSTAGTDGGLQGMLRVPAAMKLGGLIGPGYLPSTVTSTSMLPRVAWL